MTGLTMPREYRSRITGPARRLLRAAGLAFALVLAAVPAPAKSLDVNGKSIAVTSIGGVDYVAADELAAALGARCWRVGNRMVVVVERPGGTPQEYVLRPDSAFVLAGERRIDLGAAPIVRDSGLYVPAAGLPDILQPGPGAAPADSQRTARIDRFATSASADTVLLSLNLAGFASGDSVEASGDIRSSLEYRLNVTHRAGQAAAFRPARVDSGVLAQMRLWAATGGCLVKGVADENGVLVLTFRRPAQVRLTPRRDKVEVAAWPRPERRIHRVILDPGHGGKDPGAVGRVQGTQEKSLTLDICRRLQRKLTAQGYEVVLSRDTDDYVSLADRARAASHNRADLFVSVHVNASPNREACGLETYFLSEAKTDWERAVAARENAEVDSSPDKGTYGPGDLGLILADLAQSEFLHESSTLAASIQETCASYARIKDRGVKQANFYVLRNNFMPAVLVECGFLTNKSEEKLLRKPEHREKLAEGIFRGIALFGRSYGTNGGSGRADLGGSGSK